ARYVDMLALSLYARNEAIYATNDHAHLYPCIRCGIQAIDDLSVFQPIQFDHHVARTTAPGMFYFTLDEPVQPFAEIEWCDQQVLERGVLDLADDVFEYEPNLFCQA